MSRGIVYLVGAGPGDPGLLTVRALELLRSAEVVAHDDLVPSAILDLASPAAERLPVGRRRGDTRKEYRLHPEVLARARAGRRVVRLKAGDPLIFGRGAEEAEDLVDAGIPFEIVPGVSAALGAAAYAGIPLTDRRCASSVSFTTGHDGLPSDPDGRGTVVLYMGGHRLAENLRRLVEGGRAPETPAAYIERATHRDQRVILGTLGDLAQRVADRQGDGPALMIVGEVVRFREKIAWRERRPLSGHRVLVARARLGDSQIAKELRGLGADVMEAPAIEVAPPVDVALLEASLDRLAGYSAVIFACEAGVESTLARLARWTDGLATLATIPLLAVGQAAGAALRRHGLSPRIETKGACREELARLAPRLRLGLLLAVVSENGRPSLLEELTALGAKVETVPAYRLAHRFEAGFVSAPDLLVLPSSSAAEVVLDSPLGCVLKPLPMIAMGPKTRAAALGRGARDVTVSNRDTVPSLVAAVLAFLAPASGARIRATSVVPRPAVETGGSP